MSSTAPTPEQTREDESRWIWLLILLICLLLGASCTLCAVLLALNQENVVDNVSLLPTRSADYGEYEEIISLRPILPEIIDAVATDEAIASVTPVNTSEPIEIEVIVTVTPTPSPLAPPPTIGPTASPVATVIAQISPTPLLPPPPTIEMPTATAPPNPTATFTAVPPTFTPTSIPTITPSPLPTNTATPFVATNTPTAVLPTTTPITLPSATPVLPTTTPITLPSATPVPPTPTATVSGPTPTPISPTPTTAGPTLTPTFTPTPTIVVVFTPTFTPTPTSAVPVTRVTAGLVALYTFEEGSGTAVTDVSGAGPPLNLVITANPADFSWIPSGSPNGGGLTIQNTTISSPGAATKIINAGKINNAITIEAWIMPGQLVTVNNGHRIVSVSGDIGNRNVTLNQINTTYSSRIRTTLTDTDGAPQFDSANGTATLALTHLVFTRSTAGVETLYIRESGNLTSITRTVGGTLAGWDDSFPLLLGNEMTTFDRPWAGTYYLVAIYGRDLTVGEVQQNFLAGPAGS